MTRQHALPPVRARRRLLARSQSGAALVEFALVIGLFVFVLYGLIAFGTILATKQSVTNAASEAARAAVGAADEASAVGTAQARVVKALGTSNGRYAIGPGAGVPSTGPCDTSAPAGPQCITVTITYDLKGHPVVPPAPGLGLVTPDSLTSTAVVQYR
ncbi:MAG: pilus assembly protein [Actinomycetota bacterium]|nr:pilus assembly protein [Actinomycetota bacterium]